MKDKKMKNVEVSADGKTVTFTEPRRIEIVQDESPESPREWDNLGTLFTFDNRHSFNEYANAPCGYRDFDNDLVNECLDKIRSEFGFVANLYMYDHSGVVLSLSPFSCKWDSGQIGFVIVEKDKLDDDGLTVENDSEKILEILKGEIETYNQYLSNEVYGIIDNAGLVDCWGFFGYDSAVEEVERLGLSEFLVKLF